MAIFWLFWAGEQVRQHRTDDKYALPQINTEQKPAVGASVS